MSANSNNIRETAYFHFKIVRTEQRATFVVPTNLCIANFIEYIKFKASEEFEFNINTNIEIVEAGQERPDLASEDAPAIEPDINTTLSEKYNGVYEKSFYIRILQ
jgi:hypothetical protein